MSDEEDEWEDDASADDGVRRQGLLAALFWVAIVAGLVWIALNTYVQIRVNVSGDQFFGSEEVAEFFRWAQTLSGISYTVFLVSVGSYVLVWLRSRQGTLSK